MSLHALKEEEYEPVSILDGLVSTKKQEAERIQQSKDGTLPQGLKTGWDIVDVYFRYKLGNLVIINGHANVGKSFLIWYKIAISYKLHGWKWIIFCGENQSADIRRQFIEFLGGTVVRFMDDNKFNELLDMAYDAMTIIDLSDDRIETADLIIETSDKIIDQEGAKQGLLVDPYNSLQIDMSNLSQKLSTHEYHYLISTKFRKFCKKHDITTWISMHAVSEALRRVDNDGYPKPPGAADTEGGGKFINRADEFMTYHRYVQDSERNSSTEVHVRKVKDTYTGGKPTDLNNPIQLSWKTVYGFYGFYDDNNFCPLAPEQKGGIYQEPETLPIDNSHLSGFEGDAPF